MCVTGLMWHAVVEQLRGSVVGLTARMSSLENCCSQSLLCAASQPAAPASSALPEKKLPPPDDDDDDDFELFGSDDEVTFLPHQSRVPPGPYKSLKVLKFHTFKYKALKSP